MVMNRKKIVFPIVINAVVALALGVVANQVDIPLSPIILWSILGMLFAISIVVTIYLSSHGSEEEAHSTSHKVLVVGSNSGVYSNLPGTGVFIGREEEKKRVLEGLKRGYPFVVIQGPPGIGKTALALEVGSAIKSRPKAGETDLPDLEAVIWVEGHNGDLTLNGLLDKIAYVLDCKQVTQLSPDPKQLHIVKLLQQKHCLVIIDNFETISDPGIERFVQRMPAPTSQAILTTARKRQDGWLVTLGEMAAQDSRALALSEFERLGRSAPDESELRKLCGRAGGNPFHIRMMVGQIVAGVPLHTVFHVVCDEDGNFDKRLQISWDNLEHVARKVWMTLSLFQSPPDLSDIEFVSKIPRQDLTQALGQLKDLFLVESDGETDRYSLHSSTRAFGASKFVADNPLSAELYSSLANWVELYVHKHGGNRNWSGYPLLGRQHSTIITAVKWSAERDSESEKERVITIWRAIDHYMSVRGNLDEYLELGRLVLKCAESLGDLKAEVDVEVDVFSYVYITKSQRGQITSEDKDRVLDEAENMARRGLEVYQDSRDWGRVAVASRYLGMIAQERKDYGTARTHFDRALRSAELTSTWSNLGASLSSLGILSLQQKDVDTAKDYQSRRLSLAEALKDPEGISVALYNLGRLAQIGGKSKEAMDFYERAQEAACDAHRSDLIAASKRRMAECLKEGGDINKALKMAEDAYADYETMGKRSEEMSQLVLELRKESTGRPLSHLFLRARHRRE